MKVISPVPMGSGAFILHRQLQRTVKDYSLRPYSPLWELFPPAIRWFTRGEADLIHTVAEYGMFSRRNNVPQVLTLHGYNLDKEFLDLLSPLQRIHYSTDLRWFMRESIRRAASLTAVSRSTADLALRDLGISRDCQVIPNGVDVSRFSPNRGERKGRNVRVLFCGNLTRRKGATLLPRIADLLGPDIRLVCATGLRGKRKAGFFHSKVEWLGAVKPEHMPDLYRSVDMLLAPSFREGLSLTVLEGMATGLPVIASDCSSFPEQIHSGKGGYLCPPGNVEEFAARINDLATVPVTRLEMGEYNRMRVETDFDERRMVARYEDVFASALATS